MPERSCTSTARGARALLALACGLTVLAGCATKADVQQVDLAYLVAWFPGQYDNKQQAAQDAHAGKRVHPALALVVVPVDSPYIGEHVFYSQEMAADDPLRVTAQRVVSFEVVDATKIIERVYLLAEPARWRDGHLNPDIFKGLTLPDVKKLAGCDLVWTKSGERFTGANDRRACHSTSRLTGESVLIETRAELSLSEFAIGDLSYNLSGQVIDGDADSPLYRFQKRHE